MGQHSEIRGKMERMRSSFVERINEMVFRVIAISARLKAFLFQNHHLHRHVIVSESQRALELELLSRVFDHHQMDTTHRSEAVQECIDYFNQSASLEAS